MTIPERSRGVHWRIAWARMDDRLKRLTPLACSAAIAVACAAPAHGAVASFGADLNSLPANNAAHTTCADAPPGYAFGPFNSPSCMWSYIDTYQNTLTAPASGTVTQARVKVGATTGKMRINVIRFLFQQTGDPAHPTSAGPFLEAYGPEFIPAANAVTPVATSLAMREDSTPPVSDTKTIQVIDALALEVEESNVPIPIFAANATTLTYPVYPGPTASGVPAPSPNGLPTYGTLGYGVLMNADLDTGGGGGGALPRVALRGGTARVDNGIASLPIRCLGANCAGLATLQNLAGTAARKRRSYGAAKFHVKAGKSATVKVHLNKAGRALLVHRSSASIYARFTFTAGGGKPKSARVTLKR